MQHIKDPFHEFLIKFQVAGIWQIKPYFLFSKLYCTIQQNNWVELMLIKAYKCCKNKK